MTIISTTVDKNLLEGMESTKESKMQYLGAWFYLCVNSPIKTVILNHPVISQCLVRKAEVLWAVQIKGIKSKEAKMGIWWYPELTRVVVLRLCYWDPSVFVDTSRSWEFALLLKLKEHGSPRFHWCYWSNQDFWGLWLPVATDPDAENGKNTFSLLLPSLSLGLRLVQYHWKLPGKGT